MKQDVSALNPGDRHYMAYVGPPSQYDFMGATQFGLLCSLGLRAEHRLLDFGCGSLRAGRFFISYLAPGGYHGVEPNRWLIDEAIENEVGADLIRLKRPAFDHGSDFKVNFPGKFDFIMAQSIFSHAGADIVSATLAAFKDALEESGLIAATFVVGRNDGDEKGWVYPGCVAFRHATVRSMAERCGLFALRIPWYHPRQTWYLFAKKRGRLPSVLMSRYLRGAVLLDGNFDPSWSLRRKSVELLQKIRRKLKR